MDQLLQNLRPDADISDRIKCGCDTAKWLIALGMHAGSNLHQTFSPTRASRGGVETRFNRHDGQNQMRIELGITGRTVSKLDKLHRLINRNPVLAADKRYDFRLLGRELGRRHIRHDGSDLGRTGRRWRRLLNGFNGILWRRFDLGR